MMEAAALKFLKALKQNNNRSWFEANRKQYENAKTNLLAVVENLIKGISVFDPPIGQLQAKDCIFRINRDVRFSKNKDPYKSNLSAYFNKDGKKGIGAGYYLHIEPGKSMVGGGIWMPEVPVLAGIRQEIDYNYADWKKITENRNFKQVFTDGVVSHDTLVRPPKGYEENNPAIETLKMKSFVVSRPFSDKAIQDKSFEKEVARCFKTMKPFIDFLNASLH